MYKDLLEKLNTYVNKENQAAVNDVVSKWFKENTVTFCSSIVNTCKNINTLKERGVFADYQQYQRNKAFSDIGEDMYQQKCVLEKDNSNNFYDITQLEVTVLKKLRG